ncbi:zinc-binding dehydrogenase [Actinospica sp. MGRD01-02]|uniref:Zinc-binding dehydrogenase n=1 Tax=Actinospica acidithermotolerans TaxID=2828514 RepID=A0A941IG28_9ACTN|nr:zinc-binding dehydrogenase [Actinospica acidithermotolerans]MBR7825674.1 zinc-binding dehydrogenase [Actinospica acidithermotolerans]
MSLGPMWALTQTGPGRLRWSQVPRPAPGALSGGEVLLRVLAGGICGSDLPFFQGHRSPAVAPGTAGFPLHEIVGEVIESRYEAIRVGETVVGWATGQNGLAEYVVSAGHSLHAYSPGLDPVTAVLLQPLACVLYAVEQLGEVTGKHAAVLGVGPIGALFAHVLKTRGAAKVTGVDRVDRSDVRTVLGIDEFVHADASTWAAGIADADRPNLLVEAIGHQVETMTAAIQAAAYEGRVFYFGIPNDAVYPIPMTMLLRKNMTLTSGVTALPARRRVLAAAEEYLVRFPELIDACLASPYKFSDAEAAFEAAVRPRTGQMKVTLSEGA